MRYLKLSLHNTNSMEQSPSSEVCKFAFYATQRYITEFITAYHWSLS